MIDDFNFYLNGGLLIDEFNHYFKEDIESKDVDTIAGFMINQIGYVPADDERVSVRINNYVLTTSEITNGRIHGVLLNIDEERMIEVDYITKDYYVEDLSDIVETADKADEKEE